MADDTTTDDIICIYLRAGWKDLKPKLAALAKKQKDPKMRSVSAICRHLIAKGVKFKPKG